MGRLKARFRFRKSNRRFVSGRLKGTTSGCSASLKGSMPSLSSVSRQCPGMFVAGLGIEDGGVDDKRIWTRFASRKVVNSSVDIIRQNTKSL